MNILKLDRVLGFTPRKHLVDNEELRAIVENVLEGPAGDPIRLHGGKWKITEISDGVVTLKLRGACHGCPAVNFTVGLRIETAVREIFPELKKVVAV